MKIFVIMYPIRKTLAKIDVASLLFEETDDTNIIIAEKRSSVKNSLQLS